MTSILIFIASCIALVAGIGYFVFKYAPLISSLWNSAVQSFELVTALVPDWLSPFLLIIVAICIVGLLVKLL